MQSNPFTTKITIAPVVRRAWSRLAATLVSQSAISQSAGVEFGSTPLAAAQAASMTASMTVSSPHEPTARPDRGADLPSATKSPARRGILPAAIGLLLAGGNAAAVVTLDITDPDPISGKIEAQVVLAQDVWTSFSRNCANAGGVECPPLGDSSVDPPLPPQPDRNSVYPSPPASDGVGLLFSWGEQETRAEANAATGLNSILRVNYEGSEDFTLKSITLGGLEANLGPGTPGTGTGTMVAYERPGSFALVNGPSDPAPGQVGRHYATDQLMDIRLINASDEVEKTVEGWTVVTPQDKAGLRDPTTDFLNDTATGFQQWEFNQTYYFTTTGLASINAADDPLNDEIQTVTLQPGYALEFQFYEAAGHYNNNDIALGEESAPDAYYGTLDLTLTADLTPAAGLVVTPNPLELVARSGDTATSQGDLTARNDGSGTITGRFVEQLTGTGTNEITSPDVGTALEFTLAGTDEASRTYVFSAETAALSLADMRADNSGKEFSVSQTTEDTTNPTNTVALENEIVGTAVGPVFGLAFDAADALNPAQAFEYGATINLGDIGVDGGALTRELILANLFGENLSQILTTLSIRNIGLDGDDAFNIVGAYSVYDPDNPAPDPGPLLIEATNTAQDPLTIEFDPSFLGNFTTTLFFVTDMNNAFNSFEDCSAPGADFRNGCLAFTLTGRAVPAPGSLLLFMAGALAYPWLARRRKTP